jgi:hypothetical protein
MLGKDRFGSQLGTSVAHMIEQPMHRKCERRFSASENSAKGRQALPSLAHKLYRWKDRVETRALD